MTLLTVTIDGKTIQVEPGTRIIQAAEQLGIQIPIYCYHPGLSIAGNCRICLVDVEKMPKPQIACHLPVTDGMVVHTTSEVVTRGRQAVLEFLLANHPLDCPVCDQAGECWLQDYYMAYGLYDPKFNEAKVKKQKAVPIGPTVMLDSERCILCSRCVRFCDEITKTHELGIFNRGDHAELALQPGMELTNRYSGNVVDICPVGALTDRDFRFKLRVWYLQATPSVCPGCSRGCNIEIHVNKNRRYQTGDQRVMRLKPRYHAEVNQWWMCDEGRYGYGPIDQHRLGTPLTRGQGAPEPTTWEALLPELAEALTRRRDALAVLASPQLTNEDLFLVKRLFQEHLGAPVLVPSPTPPGVEDALLLKADKHPNRAGAAALGLMDASPQLLAALLDRVRQRHVTALYCFGQDLVTALGERPAAELFAGVDVLIFHGPNENRTSARAHYVLPSASYAEVDGTFTNFQGRVQRIHPAVELWGEARPTWQILRDLGAHLGCALPYASAEDLFVDLATTVPAFRAMRYDTLEAQGALLAPAEVVPTC